MGMFFGGNTDASGNNGEWEVSSKTDPRFDGHGRGFVGGFVCPPAAEQWIKQKERELGCKAPEDLTFSYMKD